MVKVKLVKGASYSIKQHTWQLGETREVSEELAEYLAGVDNFEVLGEAEPKKKKKAKEAEPEAKKED